MRGGAEEALGQFFVETCYTPEAASHVQADLRQKMPVELPGRGIRTDPHEHLWVTRDGHRSFSIDYATDAEEIRQRYAQLEDEVESVEVSKVMTRPRLGHGRPFYGRRRVR